MVAELGLPGSLVALLLLYRFGRNLKDRASGLRRRTAKETSSLLGLIALLASNAVIFVSAHQIFGDPFVYLFLGLVAGFVVAGLDEEELAKWRSRRLAPAMPTAA